MSGRALSYAVITPVRNEAATLTQLAGSLRAQRRQPQAWVLVENGSTDGTAEAAASLAQATRWIHFVVGQSTIGPTRAEPIVEAFHVGLAQLEEPVDVVVKLDADITIEPDYFERLIGEFMAAPSLGIASGSCYEKHADGSWRQRHATGFGVWGGCRAYRRECLEDVLPLEQRMGWDSIDIFKAHLRGWQTVAFLDLPFKHHRPEGVRERTAAARWAAQGEAAHYMGYRFSYMLLRAVYRSLRHPVALAIVSGYLRSVFRGDPVCPDREVRAHVRRQQSIRQLPKRIREASRPRERLRSSH
jgi:poly-beta-1,6-N-acetyl-D-glucosamine synthase